MPINVFRQSRCLNTSDSICDLFKWVCDRNDRNDKGNGKSYVRANDRGLQISCHSCHLCHIQSDSYYSGVEPCGICGFCL